MRAQAITRRKTKSKTNIKASNKQFDFVLLVTVLILLGMGIVMVLSASSPSALATTGSSYTFVSRQAVAAVIGIVAMFIISKIDYKQYPKFYKVVYAVSVIGLLLVLVPGLGIGGGGATRWIAIPVIGSLQPSEFTKIGMVVFFAAYLCLQKDNLKYFWKGFVRSLALVLPPVLILVGVQNHLSASLIIVGTVSVMMLMAGSRLWHFLTAGVLAARSRPCRTVYSCYKFWNWSI